MSARIERPYSAKFMHKTKFLISACIIVVLVCSMMPESTQRPAGSANITLFEGARLIVGDGSAPRRELGISRGGRSVHTSRPERRCAGAGRCGARGPDG